MAVQDAMWVGATSRTAPLALSKTHAREVTTAAAERGGPIRTAVSVWKRRSRVIPRTGGSAGAGTSQWPSRHWWWRFATGVTVGIGSDLRPGGRELSLASASRWTRFCSVRSHWPLERLNAIAAPSGRVPEVWDAAHAPGAACVAAGRPGSGEPQRRLQRAWSSHLRVRLVRCVWTMGFRLADPETGDELRELAGFIRE